MFTGLIEECGKVSEIKRGESSAIFTIEAPNLLKEISLGDSISVNGVCLTAISTSPTNFMADVMVQTLSLTSLRELKIGSPVNLELAAKLNSRMGGHLVQGHIDGVGQIIRVVSGEKWVQFDVEIPAHLSKFIVNQGSICLDGVSLTVGSINDKSHQITVWLIPETLQRTNLSTKSEGEIVNIEVDVIAKYVERLMNKGGDNE